MGTEMEVAEREDSLIGNLLDVTHFTEEVSAKLHRVLSEAEIYQVVKEEFTKSGRYTASILLLTDDGASLRLAETSIVSSKLEVLEKASGLRAEGYKIKLSKSSIYNQVVREEKTVQTTVGDVIREFLPRPLAFLISNTMGYEEKPSILTPIRKHGKVIGVFAMSCPGLGEYLTHSVENLALHISTALELAREHTQRKRAVQALRGYHNHLGELVEERTAELKKVNKKLRQEITERKQTEEELGKIEREKSAILNNMSEHMVYQDTEHRILWTNKAAAESVGLSIEQLAGRRCYEVWPQRNKPCVGCPVAKARETGKPQQAEITTPDGRVWFIRGYPIRGADKKLVGVVEVTLEITESKRVDQALQAEKNKLQSVVSAMEYGLTIQDRDYNIIYHNEVIRKIFGDRRGQKCYRVYEGKEKLCDGCPVEKAFRDGKSHTTEREVVMPSGEVAFWENTANPIRDATGKVVSCLEITRNITERKQAEEALRESEEFSSSLLTNAPNPVLVIGQDSSIRYVNPAFEKLSGFSSKEVIGRKAPYLWWTEETLAKTSGDLKKAMSRGAAKLEELFKKKNGERFWVEITSAPLRKDGEFKYYLANWVDITERKQAEEALSESQEKLQKMFESVTDGISVVDLKGAIIEANQRTVEMHGFASRDELLGKNALELVAPRDRGRIAQNMRKAVKEGAVRGVGYTLLRADGSEFAGELSTNVIRDTSGRTVAHITVSRDITERNRMEEALRESEERFRSIVENSQAGIMILDDAYRLIYVNDELCRISGYSREEAIGGDFRRFLDEDSKKLVADRYIRRQRGGEIPPRYEFNIVRKDGQKRRVEISSSVIRDSAGRVRTIAQILDITERKQTEQALADEATRRRILVDQSRDGIVVLDENCKVYEANRRFADMLGYSPEEVTQLYVWDWEAVASRELVQEMIRTVDEAGDHFETRHRRKDGTLIDVEISTNGAVVAGQKLVFCVCRDITERKQAEEALQAEKNKLQSVVDAMEYGLTIQDRDYNIIYQSTLQRKIWGDRLGEKCYRAYENREKICDGCPVEKAFEDGKSHTTERETVMPSGEVTFWENTASPVRDATGKVVSCLEITRNITARKQTEQALADEATRRRILIDQSIDGIVVLDENAKVYEANRRFAEMLGYTPEEVRELHTWDWDKNFPPEQLLEMGRNVDEKGLHLETQHHRKDGSVFDVDISINGAMCAGQKLIFCVCRDITERKEKEQLQHDENYVLTLLGQGAELSELLDAIVRLGEQNDPSIKGSILLFDSSKKLLFQASAPSLPDDYKELFENGLPIGPKSGSCGTAAYLKERVIVPDIARSPLFKLFEEVVKRAVNNNLLSCWSQPIIASNGDLLGTIANYSDKVGKPSADNLRVLEWSARIAAIAIESRQSEEALRESQKFSSSLLESSPNPVAVVNLDTSMRYVNPAFEKLTGFSLDEIKGRKAPYPWWPEGKRAGILDAFKDAVAHGGRRTERHFQDKNGERFWVALNSAPVMQNGKAMYLIISWLDITERKRAEEKEKQLQQELYLAQRLASVGELAAGVAHEINNPLTGVLGFSQRLMRKSTDEAVSRDLEIIHGEAQRAAEVVKNLLTFARRRQPKKEYADINDIVKRTLELRDYALQTSNIEVVTALAPNLSQIMVDFPQMQEVFLNIILNAEQAMSEAHGRGKLIIKTREMKDYVRVSFADDGPGIAPENLDKVFDPFFTTRGDRGGTGLGLSASHGIVTEHGGKIYVRSKPGKGTTFFIELPLSPVGSASVS